MGFFASQLRLDAGFYKTLPGNHSFIKTFYQYEDALFGSNNLIIAVRNTEGDIFEKDFLSKLLEVSEAVRYLPGANQASLTSLWTPNVRVLRVTEEGYEATAVIPGNIIPEDLNDCRDTENKRTNTNWWTRWKNCFKRFYFCPN